MTTKVITYDDDSCLTRKLKWDCYTVKQERDWCLYVVGAIKPGYHL